MKCATAVRVAATLVALLAVPRVRGQQVGSSTVVPIQITGDPASRFNLVVLGDGYTAAEHAKFRTHLDRHLNILWSIEPFRSYRNYFNVYAVEIVSGESGISCDPEIRQQRTTPLQLQFGGGCTNINARGVTVPQAAQAIVRQYATSATPEPDQILIIGNSDTYGGIGGRLATTTGGNALSPLITPHELGHSLGNLTDEYTYSARGKPGGTYAGAEPTPVHTTLLTEDEMRARQQKWWRWLGEPSESGGRIGRFEGGSGNTKGIWRPSKHSMMISLGYYFDQVGRERMTQRIAERTSLIAASTPTDLPVGRGDVLWIEPAHPVYHELAVTWTVEGQPPGKAGNLPYLDLATAGLGAGEQTVTVTVVDPTGFVRDPAIRKAALTATRSWKVGADSASSAWPAPRAPRIAGSTQTSRPIGASDVVYVDVAYGAAGAPRITWRLDGQAVADADDRLSFPLASRRLAPGTHTLTASVGASTDAARGDAADTRTWTIDNTAPTVNYALSPPIASIASADGSPHLFMRDEFTMKLEPADDQPGYVVAEFRVNGDGWHHYYGWPDAPPGTPFKFTPSGTNIKELIYGSLSPEGLAPQPWEPREPGWGTHRIEYRAIDAAGNIGAPQAFRVTLAPGPRCTATVNRDHAGDLRVESGVTCLADATVSGAVTVAAGASLVVSNARITGGITASGAAAVELVNTKVGRDVRIAQTTDRVTIFGSAIAGELTLTDNRTPKGVAVVATAVEGTLACSGNNAPPINGGSPNTVRRGGAGQCAGL
jgi:IgA Peptidase M64